MIGAAMQAPLAALALVLELTHSGFGLMVPMIAATVTATAVAFYVDGYSIYSARLPSRPARQTSRSPAQEGYGGFSSYLSSVSPAWAAKVGTGKTLNWAAGIGEEGNPGVADAVAHIPFSIGYIERSYSKGPALLD